MKKREQEKKILEETRSLITNYNKLIIDYLASPDGIDQNFKGEPKDFIDTYQKIL